MRAKLKFSEVYKNGKNWTSIEAEICNHDSISENHFFLR